MITIVRLRLAHAQFKLPNCRARRIGKHFVAGLLAISCSIFGHDAVAVEYYLSGFGTLGYARSNQAFNYDRFINDRGTFRRDSLAGLQVDAKLSDTFSATVQVLAAPSTDDDRKYEASIAWAFLSWRPSSDWRFRLGKQRIPLYLYSQTFNVGVTHDFVRPPIEMYSISPTNEYTGASFVRTWDFGPDELTLEGALARFDVDARVWHRDNIPGLQSAGATYRRLQIEGAGLNLAYKKSDSTFRAGVFRSKLSGRKGEVIPTGFPFVTLFPGVGFYQASNQMPGPGIALVDSIDFSVLSLGGDLNIGSGYRMVGEFARSVSNKTAFNETANRGYVAALKQIDRWTPYVLVSYVKSARRTIESNRAVNANSVPGFVPGAPLINATQRIAADEFRVWDQHSLAFGVSYLVSPTERVKAELMRVRVGRVSSLVDSPSGGDVTRRGVNVFSLSYSFAF